MNGASNFITFRAHMYHLIKFDCFPATTGTVFPRSDAAATINFPMLALAATIRGRHLLKGGALHDSLLFSSINFDYVIFKSTIFGSDYC